MRNNSKSFLKATLGILKLPSVAFLFYKNAKQQKSFIKKNLSSILKSSIETNDGSLSNADLNKINDYYALGVPGFLGASFGRLRGKALSTSERHIMTYLGGISGLLDDLFDDPHKEWSHLEKFILNPECLKPINSFEALILQLYLKGLDKSSKPEELKKKALEVFQTEKQSIAQHGKDISKENIKDLTFLKGGNSFLFYRLCMEHPLEAAEEKLIYQAGGLMQMGNDIFDVWEDTQQKIQTVATYSQNIHGLRTDFMKELHLLVIYAHATNFPKKHILQFLDFIFLGISRVLVCLDQFAELQSSKTSIFKHENYSRKQLICDMELFRNKKAAFKHYLRLHSQYL